MARYSEPTPRQLSYLNALIAKSGQTQEEWRDSMGLYDVSPWGKRLRTELITRQRVSIWIDMLKSANAKKAGDDAMP